MNIDKSVAVGVEVGGRRITVGLIDRYGQVLYRCHAKTLRGRPATATLEPYIRAIDTVFAHAQTQNLRVCGMGVSIPGTVDYASRRPLLVPLLPSLNGFPLCEFFETRYHLSTRLHADVDAAVLGEYQFGAGKNIPRLLFLTVNAVVGASLIVNGQLVDSAPSSIGHICHLPVSANGPRCSCGKRGCINTLVSMDAMQKMVQRALRRGEETRLIQRLLNREAFSPQLLAEEAAHGDSVALQVYSEVGRWLSAAVTKYIDLFEPDRLILGGDVLRASDLLLTRVRATLTSRNSPSRVCSMIEIAPARLGSDCALIGAIASFF